MNVSLTTALRIGVTSLTLFGGILLTTDSALANAKPTPPPAPEKCVPMGGVTINGGSVTNTTDLDLDADGGTAIGDGSGGDDNIALTTESGDDSDQIAAAGNGGSADASANGGAIGTGNVNSGSGVGNTISVGDTYAAGCAPLDANGNPIVGAAAVTVTGGTVTNTTTIDVSADGGTAIADASGGDNNIAINNGSAGNAGNGGIISAGNGGTANSSANGGAISLGDINSGSNTGNVIVIGNTISGGVPTVPNTPGKPGQPVPGKPITPGKPGGKTPAPPRQMPSALPDTGTGSLVAGQETLPLIALSAAAATIFAGLAGRQALRCRD